MRSYFSYGIALLLVHSACQNADASPVFHKTDSATPTANAGSHGSNPSLHSSADGRSVMPPLVVSDPIISSSYTLNKLKLDQVGQIKNAFTGVQEIDSQSGGTYIVTIIGPTSKVNPMINSMRDLDTVLLSVPAQNPEIYRPRYLTASALVKLLNASVPGLSASAVDTASVPAVTGSGGFFKDPQTQISLLNSEMITPPTAASMGMDSGHAPAGRDADAAPAEPGVSNVTSTTTMAPLLLVGSQSVIFAAKTLLEMVDIAPLQVVIEARLIETSPETLKNSGVTWTDLGGGLTSIGIHESTPYPGKIQKFGTFSRDAFDFSATINALIRDHKAKQIANPRTTVLNEQEGTIFIGDQLQYVVGQSTDTQGRLNFTLASQDVGINLIVKPIVNAGVPANPDKPGNKSEPDRVTLNLLIGASTLTGFVGTTPQVSTRRVNTTALVNNDGILAIGGLTRRQITHETQKVPILGDIPLLGQLFRNTHDDDQTTELIILLTPHIVKDNDSLFVPDANNPLAHGYTNPELPKI